MKHYPVRPTALASALFTAALIVSPIAQAQDILSILQSRAEMPRTPAPDTIPYSYTMSVILAEIEGDETRNGEAVLRIDPTQPAGSRATIVSSEAPDSKALTNFIKQIEDPEMDMAEIADGFWCGSIDDDADFDVADFTVVSETDTEAVLQPNSGKLSELLMQSESEEEASKQERKMRKKLFDRIDGQITVSKPDVGTKAYSVNMTRSMTIMVVAKIKKMEVSQLCELAPNGHRYGSKMQFSIRGKAMGTAFGQDMDIRITDLTPLP